MGKLEWKRWQQIGWGDLEMVCNVNFHKVATCSFRNLQRLEDDISTCIAVCRGYSSLILSMQLDVTSSPNPPWQILESQKKTAGVFFRLGFYFEILFRGFTIVWKLTVTLQISLGFCLASGSSMLRKLKSKIFLISIICCAEMSKKENRNIANVAEIK